MNMTITVWWLDLMNDKTPDNSHHKTQTIVPHTPIIIPRHSHWGMQSSRSREVDRGLKLLCVISPTSQYYGHPLCFKVRWNDSDSWMTFRILRFLEKCLSGLFRLMTRSQEWSQMTVSSLWLANTGHVTSILASNWSIHITWDVTWILASNSSILNTWSQY